MTTHHDPPLPPGAKAYLADFDRYLAAQIAGDTQAQREARSAMRRGLDTLCDGTDVRLEHRTQRRLFRTEASLRTAYITGEIEADEFERRLDRMMRRAA